MQDVDREYYLRRALEEETRAQSCESQDVAERHSTLAQLYRLRLADRAQWEGLSSQKNDNLC